MKSRAKTLKSNVGVGVGVGEAEAVLIGVVPNLNGSCYLINRMECNNEGHRRIIERLQKYAIAHDQQHYSEIFPWKFECKEGYGYVVYISIGISLPAEGRGRGLTVDLIDELERVGGRLEICGWMTVLLMKKIGGAYIMKIATKNQAKEAIEAKETVDSVYKGVGRQLLTALFTDIKDNKLEAIKYAYLYPLNEFVSNIYKKGFGFEPFVGKTLYFRNKHYPSRSQLVAFTAETKAAEKKILDDTVDYINNEILNLPLVEEDQELTAKIGEYINDKNIDILNSIIAEREEIELEYQEYGEGINNMEEEFLGRLRAALD